MFPVDGIIRTSEGPKKLGDIKVGDWIYSDKWDKYFEVSRVGEPEMKGFAEVAHLFLEGGCNPDTFVPLNAGSTSPYISKCHDHFHLSWFTKWDRGESQDPSYVEPPDISRRLRELNLTECINGIKSELSLNSCSKEQLKVVDRRFTVVQALFVYSLLANPEHRKAVDPLMVNDGPVFTFPVKDMEIVI